MGGCLEGWEKPEEAEASSRSHVIPPRRVWTEVVRLERAWAGRVVVEGVDVSSGAC